MTWEPGDPLYQHGSYTNYAFNFRDDPEGDVCNCGDAAHWPTPHTSRDLGDKDELGKFIEEHRRWQAAQDAAS